MREWEMLAQSVVRGQFDAASRRDFATALDAYDEDAVLIAGTGVLPTAAGVLSGREALGRWFADWFGSFAEDYRFEVEDICSVGECVVVVAGHHGRGRVSGVEIDWSLAYVFTVRAGKIVRVEMFRDRPEAVEAAQLAASAVSRKRAASITALVEAINRRDHAGLAGVLHPQFEFHAAIGAVEQRVYASSDGLWAFVADMDGTWDGYRVELEEIHDAGERAVALMHIYGTARVSGIPLDQDLAQVIEWREGKLWRAVAYTVPTQALEAVGLAE
jgi:ketosteroid isomerase-like protein